MNKSEPKLKIAQFTIGDWDLAITVQYVPFYDKLDYWVAWNTECIVDVDIYNVLVAFDHVNYGATSIHEVDFDELNGKHQEYIMNQIIEGDEK